MIGPKTKIIILILLFVAFNLVPSAAQSQEDYPNKPIQIICPYPAGGSSDLMTRVVAEKLREYLGQPVLVVNKPGAGTALGAGYVANSKPDGYTLYSAAAGIFVYLQTLNPSFSYRLSDFIPIAATARYPQVAVAHQDVPVNNLNEMVNYIKKNPGKLSYCSVGIASAGHLLWESLKQAQHLDIQHIPYTGVAPALTALIGGQSHFAIFPFSSLIIKQGQAKTIRILGVMGSKSPFLPDTATSAEQGFPDLFYDSYMNFSAPAKTPQTIIKKLEGVFEKVIQDKALREKLKDMGFEVEYLNAQSTQKYLDGEHKWGTLIKKANIISQ
jgi:tripartite-type tricarboxylate transporter receptor subunit TctC